MAPRYIMRLGKATHLIKRHYPHSVHTWCGIAYSKPVGSHRLVTSDVEKADCLTCLRAHRSHLKKAKS